MRLPLPWLCVLLLLPLLACTEDVPPPNPISEGAQPPGTPDKSKGAKKSTDANNPTAPDWKKVGEIELSGMRLKAKVTTDLSCCGDSDLDYHGSPARFYLGPADMSQGGDGFLLWLDKKGYSVLSQQTEPGVYSKVVYRSKAPAKRAQGTVHLECPTEFLPKIPIYIWAGTRFPSTVAGLELPISDPAGGIPALLIERGEGSDTLIKKSTP